MARRRRSGTAFWLFLVLLAIGAGWAANQQWRWPFPALFDRPGGQEEQVLAPEAVAERPAEQQPAVEQPAIEGPVDPEPAPEPAAAQDAEPPAPTDLQSEGQREAQSEAQSEASGDALAEREPASGEASEQLEAEAPTSEAAADDLQAEAQPAEPRPAETAPEAEPEQARAPAAESSGTGVQAPPESSGTGVQAPPASEQEATQQASPEPAITQPEIPTSEPAEAEVAALEPPPGSEATSEAAPERAAPESEATSKPPHAPQEQAADGTQPEASAEASADRSAEDAVGQTTSATPGDAAGAPTVVRPSFDIVRVAPDGRAVIAGRAEPGAEVEVRSGQQVIDRVRASRRGEWVAIPGQPLDPGNRELTVVATYQDAPPVESEQVVVVAVPEPRALAAASAPAQPEASAPSPAEVSAPEQPVAVLLSRHDKGPGRILQAPGRLSAEGTLALMTVSYDEDGEVLLSGEAPPGVPVRIYVDNRPAALVVGDAKGAWSSGLDQNLEPGTYMLRLDQLDAKGQPVARLETPFTRVSEPPIAGELQVDYVVVQPGNSLWRIARRLSGQGLDYVYIYDANQARIRDPDMIYPGQVFEVPPEFGSAG